MVFRSALPPGLAGAVRTDQALALGVTRRQLRNSALEAPFHGVRVPESSEPGMVARARAYLPLLPPGSVFSHVTAAVVWGLPMAQDLRDAAIHVSTPAPGRARRGRGVVGHRRALDIDTVDTRLGLPVTSAARTWCDLATFLGQDDLVAAGDRALWFRDPLTTPRALDTAVAATRVGRPVLRAALPLLSDRSQSHRESVLRVLVVTSSLGLPKPFPNHELVLAGTGRRVRLDLAFPEHLLGLEYEGDHHRTDRAQWRADIRRIDDLEAAGWSIMRVTDDDLRVPDALTRRIAVRLAACGWAPSSARSPRMVAQPTLERPFAANES